MKKKQLLQTAINELVIKFGGPEVTIWKDVQKELLTHPLLNTEKDLCRYMNTPACKSSFFKTIYLQQIQWNEKWTELVKDKILDMTDVDWISLYPVDEMKPHVPYILQNNAERLLQV